MIIKDKANYEFKLAFYKAIKSETIQRIFSIGELNIGTRELENMYTYFTLQNDIMDYLWQIIGNGKY